MQSSDDGVRDMEDVCVLPLAPATESGSRRNVQVSFVFDRNAVRVNDTRFMVKSH